MAGYEVTVPSKLKDMIGRWEPTGAEWIDTLPALVPDVASAWGLDLGPALEPGGVLSWIAPAGEHAMLKLSWPDDELKHEAEALLRWDPSVAVRVLRHDATRWAILLERVSPATPLGDQWDDESLKVGMALLPHLWVPADTPFRRLSDQAAIWAADVRSRWAVVGDVMSPEIIGEGLRLLEDLVDEESFLLHGDFHPGNVLRDDRRGWVVIDPKPLVGDRGFDATAMVIHGVTHVDHLRHRVATVSSVLDLDPQRLVAWTLARHVSWVLWEFAVDGGVWGEGLVAQAELIASVHER